MDQFGDTLDYLDKRLIKPPVVLQMGMQLINILEIMHNAGVTHNDIYSSNVVCGQHTRSLDKVKRCRLIDFGCSTSYLNEDGTHANYKTELGVFRGNITFASYDAMCHKVPSRKSDLIQLGYYLLNLTGNCSF